MSLFNVYETITLDAILGTGTPVTLQLGLSSSVPTDAGTLNELTGAGGYARLTINNDVTTWPAAFTDLAGKSHKRNGVSFTWPAAVGAWSAAATHWFLYDSINSRPVIWGALLAPISIGTGDIPRVAGGNLDVTLD